MHTPDAFSEALLHPNAAWLYATIWRESPISRSDLAVRTGLTKSTVSSHVNQLIRRGLIEETDYRPSGSEGGRRARLLGVKAESLVVAGVHVGVRQTRVVLADATGRELAVSVTATRRRQPAEAALATIAGTVAGLLDQEEVPRARLSAVGVVIPGSIDPVTGWCRIAPNLGWREVGVTDILSNALGVPVYGNNTAQAMAVAEAREARARGESAELALLYAGTGVGAAAVIDGRLLRGSAGFAGEIGHVSVGSGIACACGGSGCLETVVSAPAIARRWAALEGRSGRTPPVESVGRAAAAGDPVARELLLEVGRRLGGTAAWMVQLLDPRTLVLAGRVSLLGEVLVEGVRQGLEEAAMPAVREALVVRRSYLDEAGKMRGAVLTALRQLDDAAEPEPGAVSPGSADRSIG